MSTSPPPYLLPAAASILQKLRDQVTRDYERFAVDGPPEQLVRYIEDEYGLDVTTKYGGEPISNPWGKASGQLSMTARQVEEDVQAGLGFVVLKTVIAQNDGGTQSMDAWAIKESRMVAEQITSRSGEVGWTVSWKGRGWWQSFDDYLQLVRDARRLAHDSGTLIVPSCKYHLPMPGEIGWKIDEYEYTTRALLAAWSDGDKSAMRPMPIEKDFSPTLAGSDRATAKATVLEWLRTVPGLIRGAVSTKDSQHDDRVRIGLKLFNALFDDEFQVEMLECIHKGGGDRPDFFIYANRLFDPAREFEGQRGIAYGGPDLSDRNLRTMDRFLEGRRHRNKNTPLLPWSATGNITTGKLAMEYALRGASSFQLHTFFQLPSDEYAMKAGSKTQKAMHELWFHPQTGFIVWLRHVADMLGISRSPIRFRDVIGAAAHLRLS